MIPQSHVIRLLVATLWVWLCMGCSETSPAAGAGPAGTTGGGGTGAADTTDSETSASTTAPGADGDAPDGTEPGSDGSASPDAAAVPGEAVCDNEVDDDNNGLTDCDDPACVDTAACASLCMPVAPLACGATVTGAGDGPGATSVLAEYGCNDLLYTGPEVAWTVSVDAPTFVTLTLKNETDDTDVMVVENTDGACLAAKCLTYGLNDALFLAQPGRTYSVVVDGYEGAVGSFDLTADCETCAPSCAGRPCGDDGCGGSCGSCPAGAVCAPDQSGCITPPPNDTCAGATAVGPLPFSVEGDTTDALDDYAARGDGCTPAGTSGGPDVVYAFTPSATDVFRIRAKGLSFDAALYVVSDCGSAAASCIGGSESPSNEELEVGLKAGTPYFIVVDGVDELEAGFFTLTVESLGPCTPTCGACGSPDGCGGTCPCVAPPNDTCGGALAIGSSFPTTLTGDTLGASDNYAVPQGACPGAPPWSFGDGAGDVVFSLTPPQTGPYTFALPLVSGADFDAALYIVEDCGKITQTCLVADEAYSLGGESVLATLEQGVTYYVIIDGYGEGNAGSFALTVDRCAPSCTAGGCGDDGCGGSCGTCGAGSFCGGGTCHPTPTNGSCAQATAIGLDQTVYGTTVGLSDAFQVGAGPCGVLEAGVGLGSGDAVHTFTATSGGVHTVRVIPDGDWTPAVRVVGSCDGPDASCKAEGASPGGVLLPATLQAGQTVAIIVDGQDGAGAYSLTVTQCVPACGGKSCGDDGCGGTCGSCTGSDYCFKGQCVAPGCGAFTLEGCCDGAEVIWCEDGQLNSIDCAASEDPAVQTCGWDGTFEWYDCGQTGPEPSGAYPLQCPAP